MKAHRLISLVPVSCAAVSIIFSIAYTMDRCSLGLHIGHQNLNGVTAIALFSGLIGLGVGFFLCWLRSGVRIIKWGTILAVLAVLYILIIPRFMM
jgi:hypothetical protein